MLELHDLHVRYGNIRALQGVSLTVAQGELVALIGSNGAGKTTVLRTISGLLRPSQGTITFEGADISRAATDRIVALGISHCPEGRRIFGGLSVRENLRLGAVAQADKAAAAADLEMVFTLFPLLQGAPRPGRRDAVRRRAADARDRPGADEPAAAPAARRAVARSRAADGRTDLRDHRRAQAPGPDDPPRRAERPPRARCRRPRLCPRDRADHARRPGRRPAQGPGKVEQSYLGVGAVST